MLSTSEGAKKLLKTGFFHIAGAGLLNKILSFLMSVVLVRVLSKVDYGCYSYAYNLMSFFLVFNGLGVTSAILQICSELFHNKQQSDMVYMYGYRSGIVIDLAMAFVIIATSILFPLSIEGSNEILLLYCFFPLVTLLCDLKLTYLRVHTENQEYALLTNVQTILTVVFSIVGALAFHVVGLVLGQCFSSICSWLVMCVRNPQFEIMRSSPIRYEERRDFWHVSLVSALNNALSQVLALVGTALVGMLLIDSASVAEYKVATTIPFALLFLPGVVITYAYPFFARNKDDRSWTIRNFLRLIAAGFVGMGVLAALCALFAEPIIEIVFGEQYLPSSQIFRVLLIGFFFAAAFRQPVGNLLVTQRKLLFNTFVGIVCIVVCVVASIILIPLFGALGAAIAYDATMGIGAVLNTVYYCHVIRAIGMVGVE